MISSIFRNIFGTRNDRLLKQYSEIVEKINSLESKNSNLPDNKLKEKTNLFKTKYAEGESLSSLLPEVFATVREASKRVLNMRHFDEQLLGGISLHNGKISEMKTGEGKTLVATLPAYLNAITGKGVHIVTVNDYLAERDSIWMGKIYSFLGMSVGVNKSQLDHEDKKEAYKADITYGTNNEFGFDYLRDNMVFDYQDRVQKELNYAIVDEVDSILIDEARTPLIISGQADDSTDLYKKINQITPKLTKAESEDSKGDYHVDEKTQQILLSEEGHENAERLLARENLITKGTSLYDAGNINLVHHIYVALRAQNLFKINDHYVVQAGKIVIVDEFTGRLMPGRRWSDGLHQAVEAKEGLTIQKENQTLASITFQNYFRMYNKLSGMTGTADTEAYEFQHIYNLETVIIPTNKIMVRNDKMDQVYKTSKEKSSAIVEQIKECYEIGQPVLVGTTSIESSEELSNLLKKNNLKHQILNAKQHAREAEIITQAGKKGVITIATNMAGRGTDIVLGGNIESKIKDIDKLNCSLEEKNKKRENLQNQWIEENKKVLESGGLHIIGTERHESRRVDNQLRGRAGRQGDKGASRFFLSLEDPLLRIFASDRVSWMMNKLNMPDGEPIEHPWVTKAIENAQKKVEARNFDIRKQLLEYDDVANEQRKIIYEQRNNILEKNDISTITNSMIEGYILSIFEKYFPNDTVEEQWNVKGLENELSAELLLKIPLQKWLDEDINLDQTQIKEKLKSTVSEIYLKKIAGIPTEIFSHYQKGIMLQVLDSQWRNHLSELDQLRQGIHLRGYAQKNPKQEYKKEAFSMFSFLLESIRDEISKILVTVKIKNPQDLASLSEEGSDLKNLDYKRQEEFSIDSSQDVRSEKSVETFVRKQSKIGRNDKCPCGSGKKYKHCCGRN